MSQQDLFTAIGLPPMNAAEMGVSPPPVAPPPAAAPPSPNLQKPFALALLAGALAGGKATSGLVSGVVQQHRQSTQERQRQQQLDQQDAQRQQAIQAQQQQAYQAQLQRREQEFGTIVNGPNGFYQAIAKAKTPEQYDQQVQQYASLLQTRGFRVNANKLRAMAPFVVESDEQKASALVDKLLKDPLNVALIKDNPQRFLSGQVLFQSKGDKTPRQYPITQLMALAGRSVVMDDLGKPVIPEAGDGKIGTAFQEALGSARVAFKAQYNREPNPKEQQALVEKAIETTKEKPATQGGSGGLSPGMESNVLNRLTAQWTAASKPAVDLQRQIKMMEAGLAAARRGDLAPGAQAVLVTFQKVLDPTSVVRESEYARSSAGLALDDRIRGALERLAQGGAGVPLAELEKFARVAREAVEKQTTGYLEAVKARIGRTADRYKIPRDIVFEDFAFGPGTPPETPDAAASGRQKLGGR